MGWKLGLTFGVGGGTLPVLPAARLGHVGGWIGGKLYIVGGAVSGSIVATGLVWDPGTNAWSSIASMSTVREYASAGVISGKLYVTGGTDGANIALNSLEVYDPSSNSWSTLAAPSTIDGTNKWAAARAAFGVISGKLYVAGGQTNHTTAGDTIVTAYDPSSNAWSSVSTMPEGRLSGASAVYGGKLYVIGGATPAASTGTPDLRIFTPGSGWVSGTSMSISTLTDSEASVLGSTVYVTGGTVNGSVSANVYAYSTSGGTWSSATSMLAARGLFPAVSDGTYIYTTGGTGGPANAGTRFEVFDGSTWSTTSPGGGGGWGVG